MRTYRHDVKPVEVPGSLLPWAVYRQVGTTRTLVATALTEDIARRIAALLEAEP